MKLLTRNGERTYWGKDLERAITEGTTRPKIGDLVGLRRVTREAVTVTSRQRDAEGRVISQEERHAHRTRWVVEKVSFFAERVKMARRVRDEQADLRESVRAHPELKSTFLSFRAAKSLPRRPFRMPRIASASWTSSAARWRARSTRASRCRPTSLRNRSPEPPAAPTAPAPKREDPTR